MNAKTPISECGLDADQLAKLTEKKIATLGDLKRWTPKGLGVKKKTLNKLAECLLEAKLRFRKTKQRQRKKAAKRVKQTKNQPVKQPNPQDLALIFGTTEVASLRKGKLTIDTKRVSNDVLVLATSLLAVVR